MRAIVLELEVRGADGSEWEPTCDEKSGHIIEIEQEVGDATDPRFQGKVKIPEEMARKTTLAAHPGEIVEAEYDGKIVARRDEHHQIGEKPSAEAQ